MEHLILSIAHKYTTWAQRASVADNPEPTGVTLTYKQNMEQPEPAVLII